MFKDWDNDRLPPNDFQLFELSPDDDSEDDLGSEDVAFLWDSKDDEFDEEAPDDLTRIHTLPNSYGRFDDN